MTDTEVFADVSSGLAASDLAGAAAAWRACFHGWPAAMPQTGVAVTCFDEQIPFAGFMVSDDSVYLERRNPDTVGARGVVLPFANISALKIVDVIDSQVLESLGFQRVAHT